MEEDTTYVSKAILLKNKIFNKLTKTDEQINETNNNITKMNLELDRLQEEYNTYRNNDLFSEELSKAEIPGLNEELSKVREGIILRQKIIELIISLEKLKDELKDLGSEASSKRIKTENEVGQSIERMERASGRVGKYLNKIESNIKQQISEIQDKQIILKRLQIFLEPEHYDIPFQSLISKSKDSILNNERKISRLSDISQVQYTIKQNQEIQNQIQEVEKLLRSLITKELKLIKLRIL